MPDNQRSPGSGRGLVLGNNPWSLLTISFYLSQSTFVPLRHSDLPSAFNYVRFRSPDPSASSDRDQKHDPRKLLSLPSEPSLISSPLSGPCLNRSFKIANPRLCNRVVYYDNREALATLSLPRPRHFYPWVAQEGSRGAGWGKEKKKRTQEFPFQSTAKRPTPFPFHFFSIFSIFMYFYLGTSHATKRELPLDKLKRCLVAPHQISNRILGGPRALCRVHPGGLVGSHRRLRFGFYIPCVPRGRRCQGAVTRARMCSRGGGRRRETNPRKTQVVTYTAADTNCTEHPPIYAKPSQGSLVRE